jgi:hypothetical protein
MKAICLARSRALSTMKRLPVALRTPEPCDPSSLPLLEPCRRQPMTSKNVPPAPRPQVLILFNPLAQRVIQELSLGTPNQPPITYANAVSRTPITPANAAPRASTIYANVVFQPPQPECAPLAYLDVELIHGAQLVKTRALIDCRGQGNFIDKKLSSTHSFPLVPCALPVTLKLADGTASRTSVTDYTPVMLCIIGHDEWISLDVTPCSNDIILGMPWLYKHNSHLDYYANAITFRSTYCCGHCQHYGQP